jgi:tRNA-specific 2-thiouridylase|tara:strand:- start:60799 stop:61956 length:1158 start_codon:yes stop_codon:yes gene_type:complete
VISNLSDLGIGKPSSNKRVVVAMSGGVDSSVAAAICAKAGYDVVGITLQLYNASTTSKRRGACCAGQDIQDAKRVADQIGIKHYVLDYEKIFKSEVIDDFAKSYQDGFTPLPCVKCNEKIKFKDLYNTAKELGASCLITGHYVSSKVLNGKRALFRAKDNSKDQSYFLFTTTHEQLDYIRFPLGDLNKSETRDIAKDLGLLVADKPDSQDICFVADGHYSSVIKKLHPNAAEKGNIIDMHGNVLGEHNGIIHYTIGQRKGIGIATGVPNYVVKIDSTKREITVGSKENLSINEVKLNNINWIGSCDLNALPDNNLDMFVKVRSTSSPIPATLYNDGGEIKVRFVNPEYGVSPGQACVFYEDNNPMSRVLGGGWISKQDENVKSVH